jgi:SAM-dependent methyltransferase
MLRHLRSLKRSTTALGVSPRHVWRALASFPWFVSQYNRFQRLAKTEQDAFPYGPLQPCLHDRYSNAGTCSGHYFHQDLHVAREIYKHNPSRHVDVGSRIDGFVAHVAAFRTIEVLDVRALAHSIPGISFKQLDLMGTIPDEFARCTPSLSCLHALEHFGLGRYGDPIDPAGHRKGIKALADILQPHGRLYLSVPIGPTRVEFNAHRVFSVSALLQLCLPYFALESFSYVDDSGDFHSNVDWTSSEAEQDFGCKWGCGIGIFRRLA